MTLKNLAIVDDNVNDAAMLINALKKIKKYTITYKATNGRELLLTLKKNEHKLPHVVFMDMLMPNSDGLMTTILCKRLFPSIKIIALSSHSNQRLVEEFYAEKGDAFLSKFIYLQTGFTRIIYKKNEGVFENALHQIIEQNNYFSDPLLEYNNTLPNNSISTHTIISKNHNHLADFEILYLQLTAAGFARSEKAFMMNKSEATIKKYCNKMHKQFNVATNADLIAQVISNGIAKWVTTYQKPFELR